MKIFLKHVPQPIRNIALRLKRSGGEVNLVGGAVIDVINDLEPKDWDLEVFNLAYEELEKLLCDFNPKTVGKAFGVLKLVVRDGEEILDVDVNIPRADNKNGVGHQGFACSMDPSMHPKDAARRRDFTINSLAISLGTGLVIDHFGGMKDLEAGILRATDEMLFIEDPLRGLRAMQLLARKASSVDPATMTLIRSMSSSFDELPKERVFEEFRKLFMKSLKPSVGLEFLRESSWITHFPELVALIGCEQRPEWHPEGDVWTHSLLAADAAAQLRHTVPEEQREAFMFGAFLHDVGKPLVTITQKMIDEKHPHALRAAEKSRRSLDEMLLTAHGHDEQGRDPAESFLRRMTDSTKLIKLTRELVGLHMQPGHLCTADAGKGAYGRLHRKMLAAGGNLRLIGSICQCDACAAVHPGDGRSLASGSPNWELKMWNRLLDFAEQFEVEPNAVQPKVTGNHLIARGMKPSKQFGDILNKALEMQDANADLTSEEILAALFST